MVTMVPSIRFKYFNIYFIIPANYLAIPSGKHILEKKNAFLTEIGL